MTSPKRLNIALIFDSPDENWPSMDLAGEMLLDQWSRSLSRSVEATAISLRIPLLARRIPRSGSKKLSLNVDRALTRYLAYPVRALMAQRRRRFFHLVDHSYSHLVHVLPAARTGVYCHDLDAFLPVLSGRIAGSSPASQSLALVLLAGLRSARVVFHNTRHVGHELAQRGLVPSSRLVHAPLGVAREFTAAGARGPSPEGSDGLIAGLDPALSSRLAGRTFVLHVGSGIARKRLDVLFDVFARLRATRPRLLLVQQGAALSPAQRAHVERLGIADSLIQPPKLSRATLAELYRRASVVLVTSDAEGFGFPIIEALASGSVVVASDIPVLREVGGDALIYAHAGDVATWSARAASVLA
ncbi:MAG: glycosyltransferase, partial [Polyangiaceae bacterium]